MFISPFVVRQDGGFVQILQAICTLRQHLYSHSRKVLLLNQLVRNE